jgi:preprotein translocase subunit SecG
MCLRAIQRCNALCRYGVANALQHRAGAAATIRLVYTLLGVIQVIISGVLIFLILLHSGKDAGLSGAFGIGGGGSSFGGGSMVERNLDRATIFFSVLFVLNTLVLLKI